MPDAALGTRRPRAADGVLDVEQHGLRVDGNLGAENRFDAGLVCGLREFHRAMKVADVGEGNRGEAMLLGEIDDGGWGKG